MDHRPEKLLKTFPLGQRKQHCDNGTKSMLGFIRQQEKKMAMRLLTWQYQKRDIPLPPQWEMERQAAALVEEAHRIAKERGRNVVAILKELADDIRKKG